MAAQRLAIGLKVDICDADNGFCHKFKADNVFLFLGFVATFAVALLSFLWNRNGKSHSAV